MSSKYLVSVYYSASRDHEVVADSEDEARDKADELEELRRSVPDEDGVWDSLQYEETYVREIVHIPS